jgi:hypothetical protein
MKQNDYFANYSQRAYTAAIAALTCLASGQPYERADLIACAIAIESANPVAPKRIRQAAEALRTLAQTQFDGFALPAANRVAAQIVAYRNQLCRTVADIEATCKKSPRHAGAFGHMGQPVA